MFSYFIEQVFSKRRVITENFMSHHAPFHYIKYDNLKKNTSEICTQKRDREGKYKEKGGGRRKEEEKEEGEENEVGEK